MVRSVWPWPKVTAVLSSRAASCIESMCFPGAPAGTVGLGHVELAVVLVGQPHLACALLQHKELVSIRVSLSGRVQEKASRGVSAARGE